MDIITDKADNKFLELAVFSKIDFLLYSGREVIELIQVSTALDNPKTLKREIKALLNASSELNCNKLTLITRFNRDNIIENGHTIEIVSVVDWLMR